MPNFIIHIGPHKTGCTYLQAALARLAPHLRDHGILYPTDLGAKGHASLPIKLANPAQHDELRVQFDRYTQFDGHSVVLTSENLVKLDEAQIATLQTLTAAHPVGIVFYCRNWASVAFSHWNQQVQIGNPVPLHRFLQNQFDRPLLSPAINYARNLHGWANIFGKAALSLVSMDQLARAGLETLPHFCATFLNLAIPAATVPDTIRRNSAMPLLDLELIRALNQIRVQRTGLRDTAMVFFYLRNRATLDLTHARAAAQRHAATFIFDERDQKLEALHRQLFTQYGANLVPPSQPDRFFTPRSHEIAYIAQDYLHDPGVQSELNQAYAQFTAD